MALEVIDFDLQALVDDFAAAMAIHGAHTKNSNSSVI